MDLSAILALPALISALEYEPPALVDRESFDWVKVRKMAAAELPYPIPSDALVGVFGSRACGMEDEASDWDIVVTGAAMPHVYPKSMNRSNLTPYLLGDGIPPIIDGKTFSVDNADVLVFPRNEIPADHRLAGHLRDFTVWEGARPHSPWTSGYTPLPPPPSVAPTTADWFVRGYRELLRDHLQTCGYGTPPARVLDELWCRPTVPFLMSGWGWDCPSRHTHQPLIECMAFRCAACADVVPDPRPTRAYGQRVTPSTMSYLGHKSHWATSHYCSPQCSAIGATMAALDQTFVRVKKYGPSGG